MKSLLLMRHGDALWGAPGSSDFDRPLSGRGRDEARRTGARMRALGQGVDALVASPARRVVETLEAVEEGFGRPLDPVFEPSLYLASSESLLALVRGIGEEVERLMIVGHNPGLPMLAGLLSAPPGTSARPIAFATATLASIALGAERWAALGQSSGTLLRSIAPDDPQE